MTVSLDTSSPTLHDPASLLDYFTELADPRREQGRIHRLDEIIFISICAVICGADSWEEIASYAHSKIDWLQTVLTLPGGVPSHDTFRRVFCLLDPLAFQECFYAWMTAVMNRRGLTPVPLDPPELKPIAIDGKSCRGSHDAAEVRPCTLSVPGRARKALPLGKSLPRKSPMKSRRFHCSSSKSISKNHHHHRCHGLSERHRRRSSQAAATS